MSWAWHRFRVMSWGERSARARTAARLLRERRLFARGGAEAVVGSPPPVPAPGFLHDARWILFPERLAAEAGRWPAAWTARTRAEADELLAGRARILGRVREVGERPAWRRDPAGTHEYPAAHWPNLRIAGDGSVDIKPLWEFGLHAAFPVLAKAYLLTGDTAYRDRLLEWWHDWMAQNPPLTGPHYLAPVEIGIRLVRWAAALRFLAAAGHDPSDLVAELWPHVHAQRATLAGNLSTHSSANNHRLGELASLVLVDTAYPGLAPDAGTRAHLHAFSREVLLQFAPDGGNREQALHYHGFSLEFALLVAAQARAEQHPLEPAVTDRLTDAVRYLDEMHDGAGNPFLYGDDDASEVLPLDESHPDPRRAVLALGARLLDVPVRGAADDERARWILGDGAVPIRPPGAGTAVFAESGHALLRAGGFEAHLNGGALGYLAIHAHGHDDALSVAVRLDGHGITVDPGTGTYAPGDRWREWFVGAAAHPTVTLGGANRADRRGPFLWTRGYARSLESASDTAASATLDLGDGHRLTRRVRVDAHGVTVEDVLHGTGEAAIRLAWPLGPGPVRPLVDGASLRTPAGEVTLRVEGLRGELQVATGDPDHPGTPCISRGYHEREAGTALIVRARVPLPARWTTRIARAASPGPDQGTRPDEPIPHS